MKTGITVETEEPCAECGKPMLDYIHNGLHQPEGFHNFRSDYVANRHREVIQQMIDDWNSRAVSCKSPQEAEGLFHCTKEMQAWLQAHSRPV